MCINLAVRMICIRTVLVSAYFLKRCSNSIAYPVSLIIKRSVYDGSLPSDWKKANVSPLFKNGSKVVRSNYRQVSLTCILGKLTERIIKYVVQDFLLKNDLLFDDQHGFFTA